MLTARLRQKHMKWPQDHQDWTMDDWKKVAKTPGASHRWPSTDMPITNRGCGTWMHCEADTGQQRRCCAVGVVYLGHFRHHYPNNTVPDSCQVSEHRCVPSAMPTVFPAGGGHYQQDNATLPKMVKEWFKEHDGEFLLMPLPPNSPDIKPIEKWVRATSPPPHYVRELEDLLLTLLYQIPQELTALFYSSECCLIPLPLDISVPFSAFHLFQSLILS